jgi:hypothetical protein
MKHADLIARLEGRIGKLYADLTAAHYHPFDWMLVLRRPSILMRYEMAGWKKNVTIFAVHGFMLTDRAADRFHQGEPQQWNEDAGGAIIRRLIYALEAQLPEAALLKAEGG